MTVMHLTLTRVLLENLTTAEIECFGGYLADSVLQFSLSVQQDYSAKTLFVK